MHNRHLIFLANLAIGGSDAFRNPKTGTETRRRDRPVLWKQPSGGAEGLFCVYRSI